MNIDKERDSQCLKEPLVTAGTGWCITDAPINVRIQSKRSTLIGSLCDDAIGA
jgi:hypothetical protein